MGRAPIIDNTPTYNLKKNEKDLICRVYNKINIRSDFIVGCTIRKFKIFLHLVIFYKHKFRTKGNMLSKGQHCQYRKLKNWALTGQLLF